eukprot:jgi/Ulvmu1/8458/UM043_0038.1
MNGQESEAFESCSSARSSFSQRRSLAGSHLDELSPAKPSAPPMDAVTHTSHDIQTHADAERLGHASSRSLQRPSRGSQVVTGSASGHADDNGRVDTYDSGAQQRGHRTLSHVDAPDTAARQLSPVEDAVEQSLPRVVAPQPPAILPAHSPDQLCHTTRQHGPSTLHPVALAEAVPIQPSTPKSPNKILHPGRAIAALRQSSPKSPNTTHKQAQPTQDGFDGACSHGEIQFGAVDGIDCSVDTGAPQKHNSHSTNAPGGTDGESDLAVTSHHVPPRATFLHDASTGTRISKEDQLTVMAVSTSDVIRPGNRDSPEAGAEADQSLQIHPRSSSAAGGIAAACTATCSPAATAADDTTSSANGRDDKTRAATDPSQGSHQERQLMPAQSTLSPISEAAAARTAVDITTSMERGAAPVPEATPTCADRQAPAHASRADAHASHPTRMPEAVALPSLRVRVPRPGELTVQTEAFTSSALGSTARLQGARMRLCQNLLKTVNTCAKLPVRRTASAAAPTADQDDPNVADVLYHAAVALLSLLAASDDLASIGLAFYGAAPTLASALRAPRTLRDWGARVVVLAVAARVAAVDDDAARQLLREGMLAAVELALHVSTESADWLSVHLCLDLLLRFLACSADTALQALACPLLETLVRLIRRAARALHAVGSSYSRYHLQCASPPVDLGRVAAALPDAPTPSLLGAAAPSPLTAPSSFSADSSPVVQHPAGPLRISTSPETCGTPPPGGVAGAACPQAEPSLAHLATAPSPLSSPAAPGGPRGDVAGPAVRSTPQPPGLQLSPVSSLQTQRSTTPTASSARTTLDSVPDASAAPTHDCLPLPDVPVEQQQDCGGGSAAQADGRSGEDAERNSAFAVEPDIGRQPDLQIMKKALRLLSALASQSPAHQQALQQVGAVRLLMAVIHACEHDGVHLLGAPASAARRADAASSGDIAAVHAVLVHALWALTEVVDGCGEAQRDFLESDSMPTVSGLLSRVLRFTALAKKFRSASAAQATSALQRRSAELRHAYATHMEVERMAALAIATPRSPLLDTLFSSQTASTMHGPGVMPPSAQRSLNSGTRSPLLCATPGATSSPRVGTPVSSSPQGGPPAYLEEPFAHAEKTLELLGCPARGTGLAVGGRPGAAGATEAGTLLSHLNEEQALECLGTLGRLVRALTLNSSRCQQALRDTATPLVFLQALRVLNSPSTHSLRNASADGRAPDGGRDPAGAAAPSAARPHRPRARAPGTPTGSCYSGVDLHTLKYVTVGGTVIAACRHVKTSSASRTFRNYGRLCRFSRFIVRWLDFHHAEQQWLALRCWLASSVLLRDPPKPLALRASAADVGAGAAASVAGWPHACGTVPTGLGAPPQLVPLEEVASALALVGFTAALQAKDVMDSTLSGVVLMLGEGPSSGLTLGACEVLQQMARLSPAVAAGILSEGGLWRLVQLLISFQQLLEQQLELMLRAGDAQRAMRRASSSSQRRSGCGASDSGCVSSDGPYPAGERRMTRCASTTVAAAYAALEREREAHPALPPLPSGAIAVAQAVTRTSHVLLEQHAAAQHPFLAMGGVHVLMQLLRDLKGMGAPVQPQLLLLLGEACRGNPAAQAAAVAEGAPLLVGRILEAAGDEARSSDVVELQRCCCTALAALLDGCTKAQASIVGTVTVPALERLMPRPSDVMSGRLSRPQLSAAAAAAEAIAAAARHPSAADAFGTLHSGANIAAALALPPFEAATRSTMRATRALCAHCSHANMRASLYEYGGLEALCVAVNIVGVGEAQEVRELSIDVVQTLECAVRGDCDSMDFATSGQISVLPMLVRMLGTGRDSVLAAAAARCLAELVCGIPRLQRRAAAAGASEALLFLAAGGPATAAAAPAAAALSSLCKGEPAPARAVCAGGGTKLLAQLLPSCGDAAAEAATALATLAAADPDAAAEAPSLLPQLLVCAAARPLAPPPRWRCAVAAAAAAARLLRQWPEHADSLVAGVTAANIATALRRCAAAAPLSAERSDACIWRLTTASLSQPTSPNGTSIPALHSFGSLYGPDASDTDLLVELKLVPDACAASRQPTTSASGGSSERHMQHAGGVSGDPLSVYADTATRPAAVGREPGLPSRSDSPGALGPGAAGPAATATPAKAPASMQLRSSCALDAAAAVEQGWLEVAELAVCACDASPAIQAGLRDGGAVEAVVPFLRSADASAAEAACEVTGALAAGDAQAKRRILEAGGCTALVELLLRCASTDRLPAGATFRASSCEMNYGTRAEWHTAAKVEDDMMKDRCGFGGTGAAVAIGAAGLTACDAAACSRSAGMGLMHADEVDAPGVCGAAHACPGTAAALREAVVLLGAVLDGTSASAMQQLSLSLHSQPIAGVAKGVLGATASLVAAFGSSRRQHKGAASPGQHAGSMDQMHDEGHAMRARMAATEARAFAQVAAVIDALEAAPLAALPAGPAPLRRKLRTAAGRALLKLCSGSLEARNSVARLQRQMRSLTES